MSKKVKKIVNNVIDYEALGNIFIVNALMKEAQWAIKYYTEKVDDPRALIHPKAYALIAENVKQQLETYLEENK